MLTGDIPLKVVLQSQFTVFRLYAIWVAFFFWYIRTLKVEDIDLYFAI